jgi:hypothetical protein
MRRSGSEELIFLDRFAGILRVVSLKVKYRISIVLLCRMDMSVMSGIMENTVY